jgi:hypothetical protein
MTSRPRGKKAENSARAAWISGAAGVLILLLIIMGVILLAFHLRKGSSLSAPKVTSSSRQSVSATGSGSPLSGDASPAPTGQPAPTDSPAPTGQPAPTDSPSILPTPSSAVPPANSPSATSDPTSVPSSPIPTGTIRPPQPTDNPQLSLWISASATPVVPGTYMSLTWTPTVTLGSQTVVNDCQITWKLWKGRTLIDNTTTFCIGTFELLNLPIGNYLLVGRVSLPSGEHAQRWVAISTDCETIGSTTQTLR